MLLEKHAQLPIFLKDFFMHCFFPYNFHCVTLLCRSFNFVLFCKMYSILFYLLHFGLFYFIHSQCTLFYSCSSCI